MYLVIEDYTKIFNVLSKNVNVFRYVDAINNHLSVINSILNGGCLILLTEHLDVLIFLIFNINYAAECLDRLPKYRKLIVAICIV